MRRHVQLKQISSTAVRVVGALVHLTWETLWRGERQLKDGILAVNVSRETGGMLTVHCCWTASHVTVSANC
jgi:hypothetical protein